jgi:capsid protein
VDPAKEVQAYKDAVRCGFKTLGEVVAEQGGDLEELMLARAAELEMADQMSLVFDTDPHEVNAAGTEQPSDPAEDQAETNDPASDNGEDDTENTDGPIA